MTTRALGWIGDQLTAAGIAYEYGIWQGSDLPDPYFIGELTEAAIVSEDGLQEGTLMLTGTSRTSFICLEEAKAVVKDLFPPEGTTTILSNGNGLAVAYSYAMIVPVDDYAIKRMQINLDINEWSVNNT